MAIWKPFSSEIWRCCFHELSVLYRWKSKISGQNLGERKTLEVGSASERASLRNGQRLTQTDKDDNNNTWSRMSLESGIQYESTGTVS
jgi:hypothetical protein